MPHATGRFDVTLTPAEDDNPVGRRTITKQFEGDLTGTSIGQMLAMRSATGSAAYVAMEEVQGTLAGRSGTFVLVHRGLMSAEQQTLEVAVMPGSGTGELEGLTGSMTIEVAEGEHRFGFEWSLPD